MGSVMKTFDAEVLEDGTVVLKEPMKLSRPVAARVTFLVPGDSEEDPTDAAVADAADRVFAQHDELFKKLAR